jgi:hypothetical protein
MQIRRLTWLAHCTSNSTERTRAWIGLSDAPDAFVKHPRTACRSMEQIRWPSTYDASTAFGVCKAAIFKSMVSVACCSMYCKHSTTPHGSDNGPTWQMLRELFRKDAGPINTLASPGAIIQSDAQIYYHFSLVSESCSRIQPVVLLGESCKFCSWTTLALSSPSYWKNFPYRWKAGRSTR